MAYRPQRPTRSLLGKVAIVTGAGSFQDEIGNGRAISILLAEDGCSVVCVDINLESAQRTVQMIETEDNGHATAIQADITSVSDCQQVVDAAVRIFGRLDILINCVGIGGAPGTAVDVDMQKWAHGLEINVSSMVQMAKYAIPAMIKNEPWSEPGYRGSIVNMGSVAGVRGGTPHLLYPTSKGAVVNMTRAMAFHHAEEGIRVNCVCPGMVYTPMMYAGGMSEEARAARKNRSLLKTEGNAWDVASAIRFLAGNEARWITGLIMEVDAGVTCSVGTDIPKSASVNG